MLQLDLFSALQSSTGSIDTEFQSTRGDVPDGMQALRQSVFARQFSGA